MKELGKHLHLLNYSFYRKKWLFILYFFYHNNSEVKKMKKIWLICLMIFTAFFSVNAYAFDINESDYIYVGGQNIGLEVQTNVTVVGSYGIEKEGKIYKPWQESGIKDGDLILKYNSIDITNSKMLLSAIYASKDNKTSIVLKRSDQIIETSITPVENKNSFSLGLYIKDSILGVGTLTYYIPKLSLFGSLGHSITSSDTFGGKIYNATVNSIVKSERNHAGEKRASITGDSIGVIKANTISGVHGISNQIDTTQMKKMQFATRDEVHTGPAKIRTCINGNKVEEFDVRITKCNNQSSQAIKGIKLEITDEDLIARTGGIIQGMSGSPIIQDNKLIGAVTHVILSNPLEGYGIYLEFMYEDLNINIVK